MLWEGVADLDEIYAIKTAAVAPDVECFCGAPPPPQGEKSRCDEFEKSQVLQLCTKSALDFAGKGQALIFSHTNNLSENYFATTNICSHILVSTRVGGYMRGTGLGSEKV